MDERVGPGAADSRHWKVLLSVQRALLGTVGPNLRGVAAAWDGDEVRVVCYFHGPISDVDREEMSVAETEVMADFLDIDMPEKMNGQGLRAWVFLRKE